MIIGLALGWAAGLALDLLFWSRRPRSDWRARALEAEAARDRLAAQVEELRQKNEASQHDLETLRHAHSASIQRLNRLEAASDRSPESAPGDRP